VVWQEEEEVRTQVESDGTEKETLTGSYLDIHRSKDRKSPGGETDVWWAGVSLEWWFDVEGGRC
jgi:hypothetical protein